MHVELRRSGVFDRTVELPKYDGSARSDIIKAIITKRADAASSVSSMSMSESNKKKNNYNTDQRNDSRTQILLRARQDLDYYDLALRTEGYGPSDLDIVLERVINRAACRVLENVSFKKQQEEVNGLMARQKELENALKTMAVKDQEHGETKSNTNANASLINRNNGNGNYNDNDNDNDNDYDNDDEGDDSSLVLTQDDFEVALKGYVPASLRGIKLTKSNISWNDVGGLNDVR